MQNIEHWIPTDAACFHIMASGKIVLSTGGFWVQAVVCSQPEPEAERNRQC